ncbi:MAG: [Fe-S]-binding protein, partial [Deltaproteobacteria bacterium]|nr:[Fe-S]-binding protein [Deltaproteobacteria bacterium]
VESGLIKMCLIGLGKREGAGIYHRAIDHYSWDEVVDSVREILLSRTRVKFGLAILENAHEETAEIVGLKADEFYTREPALLNESREMMPFLPFEEIDLLIVDEMGKEFSGTGMDTNITGRKPGSALHVLRIYVRDLTLASNGNAQGIGLADFTTARLVEKIDYNALYLNSRTAHRTDSCKIPMTFENDRAALEVALEMTGIRKPQEKRIVWIKNTLELQEILASQAYLHTMEIRDDLEIIGGPYQIEFDKINNLVHPFQSG